MPHVMVSLEAQVQERLQGRSLRVHGCSLDTQLCHLDSQPHDIPLSFQSSSFRKGFGLSFQAFSLSQKRFRLDQ